MVASWDTLIPEEFRFCSTQQMFLRRGREPTTNFFDDSELIRSLAAGANVAVPERRVVHAEGGTAAEWWTWTPRRCVPSSLERSCGSAGPCDCWCLDGEIAAFMSAMKLIGKKVLVTMVISHHLIYDEWPAGNILGPTEEKNRLIECGAVRSSASQLQPMKTAVTG